MSSKKIIFFFFFLLFFFQSKSQERFYPKHTVVLEAGGVGGYGSLNYERSFLLRKNHHLAYKVGFSFFRFKDYEREFNPDILLPISIQLVKKFRNHYTILGFGKTISSIVKASPDFSSKIRKTSLSSSFILGYRFQKENKPFSIQISYNPVFQQGERFRYWGSIGFGYSFIKKK